jgi:hypothetical protein
LWPVGLDDDARTIDLLEGDAPAQAQFSPERWAVVMVEQVRLTDHRGNDYWPP